MGFIAIRVETSTYEFSHGKQPRGIGYWGFEITWAKNPAWPNAKTSQVWKNASYSEAKAAALAEVSRCANMGLMASSVSVLP